MRVLIAVAVILSASLAMAVPAESRQNKKGARSPDYSTSRAHKSDYYHAKGARDEAHDCVRAQSLDPAGDYKAYPCWARAALSSKEMTGK
jgi:hypothetical protein